MVEQVFEMTITNENLIENVIPSNTKMFAKNQEKEPLERIIVKSPAPVINEK